MAVLQRGLSPLVKQGFVTASICLNILGHGCVVGFPAILLPQLEQPDSLIPLGESAKSWLASIMMIPILSGNFSMPSIMDRMGRRVASVCVMVTAIVGWLITVLADNLFMLFLARICLGLSFGLNMPLRSAFIGEYTSPKYRGAFLMFVGLAQGSGIFMVHTLGTFIPWQKTALICISFHFVSLVMMLYAPESPSFLAKKGRVEECQKVFRWLRGDGEEKELQAMIEAQSHTEQKRGFQLLTTLKKKEFYKPVTIMVHANALMQFAGGTTFSAYSTVIITLILGTSENAYFWMIFLDGQRIVSNIFAVYLINKFKRRTMLFSITGLCIASHVAIAAYVFARNSGFLFYEAWWIPILLVNLQMFSVATGMVPLPLVIAGEVFPYEYRGLGGSVSIVSVSLTSFLVLKTFHSLSFTIGIEGLYALYAIAMTYFVTVIWFILPETKDKTLQQIEDEFRGKEKIVEDGTEVLQEKEGRRKVSVSSHHSLTAEL